MWQFYHPPLWHMLGAVWLYINDLLKVNFQASLEGIQILSLMISAGMIILADKICLKLKLKDAYRYLADLLFAVHPFLIVLSGSINNDCLVNFMEMYIIYRLIVWYEEDNFKNVIYLAIVTGLCVMTKINGAVMAIPIMYAFIRKFISYMKEKNIGKKWPIIKTYILKMVVFGFISLPIGLWFQVRNYIKFGENIVPEPADWLYRGDYSLMSRFIKIDFANLYGYADTAVDYNLSTFLLKSSMFSEYNFGDIQLLRIIMITLNLILAVLFIILTIKYLFKKDKNVNIDIQIVTFVSMLIAMCAFYYKYPYSCSMDFRYIAVCLLPCTVTLVYGISDIKHTFIRILLELICLSFVIASIIFVFLI